LDLFQATAYSSHSFAVTLRQEITSVEEVDAEVERGYARLQAAVDGQITNAGFVPGDAGKPPTLQRVNGAEESWACSAKQRELIEKIIAENNLDRSEVDALAVERFGKPLVKLNKLSASGVIDELFRRCGRNGNGRRQQTRRAA